MKKSKQIFLIIAMGVFIVPQIALASWWNPFSWSIFHRTETKTQILENKVKELEKKLEDTAASPTPITKETSSAKIITKKIETNQNIKVEAPKPTSPTETPKVVTTPTVSVSNNPSAQCLDPKKKWDDFIKSIDALNKKYSALYTLLSEYSGGTKNKPTDVIADISYKYSRMNAGKTKFSADVKNFRTALDTMTPSPVSNISLGEQVKNNYENSLVSLESSYDLYLAAFKIAADDEDGLSRSEIDATLALWQDAVDAYGKALNEQNKNNLVIISMKNLINTDLSSGPCYFAFRILSTDNTVWTTTKEEQNFSRAQPSVSANRDYTQATITLSTNLPIEITEEGKTKTIMRLKCSEKIIGVKRTNQNSVYVEVSKALTPEHQCVFTYSGSGNTISSLTATLPW